MICGVDEAGRGPVIGPMVVAGVQVEDENAFEELNIRDSKKCTPRRRDRLVELIKEKATKYETIVIQAKDIDVLRKTMTLNEIEVNVFAAVMKKLRSNVYYVDSADVDEQRFSSFLEEKLGFKAKIVSSHKADDIYIIVGAASILAKTTRDKEVEKIAKKLEEKLGLPLGSGYPADPVTQRFLKTWVERFGSLPPETRESWKTVQRLLKEQKNMPLDRF
ncbi:MAG TPA: ribonuclease HII [Thermoplasmata archaeon]|nr:ribonuclease HII [Thermoplasmata archaeon]